MTTFAETPPYLRRLFDRLDYAPQPQSEPAARMLTSWRTERDRSPSPWPSLSSLTGSGDAPPALFGFGIQGDRDYRLVVSGAEAAQVIGACAIGASLTTLPQRRLAVRLRRLFATVRSAGEPVLVQFRSGPAQTERAFEMAVAPCSEGGHAIDSLIGCVASRAISQATAPAQTRTGSEPSVLPIERGAGNAGLAQRSASQPPSGAVREGGSLGRRSETDCVLFALGSSRALGTRLAERLGRALAAHEEREFEDGEHKARPLEDVQGRRVAVLHSLYGDATQSPNDKLCRLLFFIAAVKDAGAAQVTAIVPYLCYARKDQRTKLRDPVTLRYVARLFEAMGTDHVITLDVHNIPAFDNAFRCRADNVSAVGLFARHLQGVTRDLDVVVVSPDLGGLKRAELMRAELETLTGRPVTKAFMDKQRSMGRVTGDMFAGDVSGKAVIIIDDLISTGTTVTRVAAECRKRGAVRIDVAATHGLFSGGALELRRSDAIDTIVVTDTIDTSSRVAPSERPRFTVLESADLLASVVRSRQTDL